MRDSGFSERFPHPTRNRAPVVAIAKDTRADRVGFFMMWLVCDFGFSGPLNDVGIPHSVGREMVADVDCIPGYTSV